MCRCSGLALLANKCNIILFRADRETPFGPIYGIGLLVMRRRPIKWFIGDNLPDWISASAIPTDIRIVSRDSGNLLLAKLKICDKRRAI